MIDMDVRKLSISQDGESWRGTGWSSAGVAGGCRSAVYLTFLFFRIHFVQPWRPSCFVLGLPNKSENPIDLIVLRVLRAKRHGTEVMECPIREAWQ